MTARDALRAVVDPGTYRSWDEPLPASDERGADVGGEYADQLASAARASGSDEAVLTGEARIGGVRAAVIAWEFGFLGGSVGVRTATRIVSAIRRATGERVPLLAMPRSGGTRMQEGSPAFVQMIAITGAVAEHRAAGLPYLVHLCGPTTGGVLATLGSAGDLTTAEPGAMVGFLGPRAVAAITGKALPDGVQVAENLARRGVIDEVLEWESLSQRWETLLRLWEQGAHGDAPAAGDAVACGLVGDAVAGEPAGGAHRWRGSPRSADDSAEALWSNVAATRSADRVGAEQFVAAHMRDIVGIPGTQSGQVASGTLVVIGRLHGRPVVLAATCDRRTGMPLDVAGLRTIRRGMELAGRWGLPLVTVVDTLGAELSAAGEESGIAGEISRVMLDLVSSPSPTAALLLGAGTGGAALALLATDRIIACSRAWLAPLAPEGAAAIRHGGGHDPAGLAAQQRVGARALADLGVIDAVVDESEPGWVGAAADALVAALPAVGDRVRAVGDRDLRMARFAAWR